MIFPHKIPIDMFEFLKMGKFDYIEIGQTQAWILNNFPDPDDFNGKLLARDIWRYGMFEFNFSEHKLTHIFSDHFQHDRYGKQFNAGNTIDINPWIFAYPKQLTLQFVMQELTKHQIDFNKKTEKYWIGLTTQGGIKLMFEIPENSENTDPNTFLMVAFSFYGKNEKINIAKIPQKV